MADAGEDLAHMFDDLDLGGLASVSPAAAEVSRKASGRGQCTPDPGFSVLFSQVRQESIRRLGAQC